VAFKILLTTTVGWPSVARLAHGFVAASCSVDAHAPAGAPVSASRYVGARYGYRPLSPISSLRTAIMRAKPNLIVACDDRAVAHMLRLYSQTQGREPEVAGLLERSLGEPASYPEMMSRSGFLARARLLGVRVPETRSISSDGELDDFIAEAGLPIVLKADGSWGGDGVIVAHDRAEARSALRRLGQAPARLRSLVRAFRRRDAHHLKAAIAPAATIVSAQAFVVGRSAASAFACWQGEILGAIYYDVLVSDGEVGPPNVIRRVDCPEMESATRNIARHYRLSGIHGMDFLRDAAGAVHLIEINPRATQGGALPFGPGRDLPAALSSRLWPGTGMRPPILNDTVVIFPREWRRDPASPWLGSAHHDVPWDDPAVLLALLRGGHPPPASQKHQAAKTPAGEAVPA